MQTGWNRPEASEESNPLESGPVSHYHSTVRYVTTVNAAGCLDGWTAAGKLDPRCERKVDTLRL